MRGILFIMALFALVGNLKAQPTRKDIQQDIRCSAGYHLPYPGPARHTLIPAPKGKQPIYMSHYGCHGSRYHTQADTYVKPCQVLAAADSLGKLTAMGQDVLQRLDRMRQEADQRWGEITELGARQQREIADRMAERFPELFTSNADVNSRSTFLTRCILSMENAMVEFALVTPVKLHHNTTQRDTYYLNFEDKRLLARQSDSTIQKRYQAFASQQQKPGRLMRLLFNDTAYVRQQVDVYPFYENIFRLAGNLQNLELRNDLTLYDLFTSEEIYDNWRAQNAWSYITYGGYAGNGGQMPYSQRYLLRKMIEMADSCVYLSHPTVELRFGDETGIIPLVCLLDINGFGLATDQLEKLDHMGWADYKISPMGANVQLIFYRGDEQDDDILVKVLLNEDEATLPVPTDMAPYYHWQDVRTYYLKKLDAYED